MYITAPFLYILLINDYKLHSRRFFTIYTK